MLESIKTDKLEYQKLTPEEMKKRGILGRLVGPIADTVNPTRNGRKYSEELWEKAFSNPITQERIKNGLFFGEIEHPEGRTQTDPEKIAVCMREQPKKNNKGQLVAVLDILDTPNGRILKTLCDYGSVLGISSRGTGEVTQDGDGNDIVDPGSYECEAFDIVSIPAVETARLQYVTESLNGKTLNEALKEDIKNADAKGKKIMEETLKDLKIDIKSKKSENTNAKLNEDTIVSSTIIDSKTSSNVSKETVNDRSKEVVKNLQEALKENTKLELKVQNLQEELAISNAKVDDLQESVKRFQSSTINLSTTAKQVRELSKKVSELEESLEKKEQVIAFKNARIVRMIESKKSNDEKSKSLNESISSKDGEIAKLNESLKEAEKHYNEEIKKSKDELVKVNTQLQESKKLEESYKKLAESGADKYIGFRAKMLGVSVNEIKNKLPSSYSFSDIDEICESISSYKLNIKKLPLAFDRKVKVKVNESKSDKIPFMFNNSSDRDDDSVDESLIRLAGLDK